MTNDGKTALDITSNEDIKKNSLSTLIRPRTATPTYHGTNRRSSRTYCKNSMERIKLLGQYTVYEKNLNFVECAKLWTEIETANAESLQLNLSVNDFRTLSERHSLLMQRIEVKCKQLLAVQKFDELATTSHLLDTLRGPDPTAFAFPADYTTSAFQLGKRVDQSAKHDKFAVKLAAIKAMQEEIKEMMAGVPAREGWMKRRKEAQAAYEAAERGNQYSECARLGKAIHALDNEEAKFSLSHQDYQNWPVKMQLLWDKHQELLAEVEQGRIELLYAKDFNGLDKLTALFTELQALDISALVPPSARNKSIKIESCSSPKLDPMRATTDPVAPVVEPRKPLNFQKRSKRKVKCNIM